jgi:hypothetical protein
VVETKESRELRLGEKMHLSTTEQMELKIVAQKYWNDSGYITPPKEIEVRL